MDKLKHDKNNTHFGYQEIPTEKKAHRVAEVFHSVAKRYDLMNDVMSFGLHRLWKRITLSAANVRPGMKVLDVAAGTGDLSLALAKKVGPSGLLLMSDINEAMLRLGRDRLINAGMIGNVHYAQADAEALPFADSFFDRITIGFGLRNVTHKELALQEFYRVLKPGGKCLILEFSTVQNNWLHTIYDMYSFHVIPKIGELLTEDKESYQYLVESIRMHPDQETLKQMLVAAQFEEVTYRNLNDGIVALHIGHKY